MAMKLELLITLALACATLQVAIFGDADILIDFVLPTNLRGPIDGNFFTFTGMRVLLVGVEFPPAFKVLKSNNGRIPCIKWSNHFSCSSRVPSWLSQPPHTHPRASELLFLIDGSLQVGFVDTTNKLYTQTLQVGDIFVFPKGLVHFQYNSDAKFPALAISSFGSASAVTVSVPSTVFNTSISDGILDKSFKTDVATIHKLKAGLQPRL